MMETELRDLGPASRDSAVYHPQQPSPPRTLIDILDASVAAHPKAAALDDGVVCLSYAKLAHQVDARAAELRAAGISVGDRVGVRLTSGTTELYVAILAILAAGAAYVPVDVDDAEDRAQLVWEEAAVCAVLGDGGTLTPMPRGAPVRAAIRGPPRRPAPADDAWIIFTSGSTGKPKGVAVTHRSAAAFVDAEARLFLPRRPIAPGDRVLAGLSVAFDASCEEMWLAWRHGACLIPAPRSLVKAGADLGTFLAAQRISVVSTVPTLAALWPADALRGLRLLILGGEACSPELAGRLANCVGTVWNTYGPTEATVVACAAPLAAGRPVRIGLPLAGWKLAVIKPDGHPVRWGETGELAIGGVGLARYLDQAKDAAKFAPLPVFGGERAYRSGDLVRAEPEGLIFIGRNDEQIKISGRRVELGEVDAALMALPGVSAAASAVRRTELGTPVLVGYIVRRACNDGADTDTDLLQRRLPAGLVPILVPVDKLPMRTSGKVDRAALPWPPPQAATDTGLADGTVAWLAEQWRRVLGVLPAGADAHFFALGGTSLAAAQLVSQLRRRCPILSMADMYEHPTLTAMAARVEELELAAAKRPCRVVLPTPRRTGFLQLPIMLALLTLEGLRWLVVTAIFHRLTVGLFGSLPQVDALMLPWWPLLASWLVLVSTPGRVVTTAGLVRLLTAGIRSGAYCRGGSTHLRLWTAERLVMLGRIAPIAGTHWCRRYARLLGCRVGANAQIHALPPVTGLASFGTACAVEFEADVAGWWLDGDILRVGSVTIGPGARVGARAMLMPGVVLEPRANVEPGTCVTGTVKGDGFWDGPAIAAETVWTHLRYTLSLLLLDALPVLAAMPMVWICLVTLKHNEADLRQALVSIIGLSVPGTLLGAACYAALIAGLVRLAGRHLRPGIYPWQGVTAWAAWLTLWLMTDARLALFPLYASVFTPHWLRVLGARIGKQVEASTVIVPPSLLHVDDGAFLADDVLLAPYELRPGQLCLGTASIGQRVFVGNSGLVELERDIPRGALVGVLGTAPPASDMEPNSSWLGRPPMALPHRVPETAEVSRTFEPARRLVVARTLVETCRMAALVCSSLLAEFVVLALVMVAETGGFLWAFAVSGLLLMAAGVVACALATAARRVLTPSIRRGQRHPLWSSFVWRNELAEAFVDSLALPWLGRLCYGTPFMSIWLRSLGATVGPGVWCESHRLPEADLVDLGAGATVNRGCILQTHLFHDRLMRLDVLRLHPGATLGPYSIALPGAVVGGSTTIGPSSLVMSGEHVPAGTRWLGNPVRPWQEESEGSEPRARAPYTAK